MLDSIRFDLESFRFTLSESILEGHFESKEENCMNGRVNVTLSEQTMKILDSVNGMGDNNSQKVRSIVQAWLSEKGFIKNK